MTHPPACDVRGCTIAGIGAIAVDHVFVARQGHPFRYHSSRGGGSVWNLLAHLAQAGFTTMACGAYAGDELGTEAVHELAYLGVDISGLARLAGKHSPVFTQWLDNESRHGPPIPQDNFTLDCPICGRAPSSDDVVQFSSPLFAPGAFHRDRSFVCTDRLTAETISAGRRATQTGSMTALDLGGVSGLKGLDLGEPSNWVSEFDVVAMPNAVASLLTCTTVADFAEKLLANRTAALAITRGRDGFHLYLRASDGAMIACTSSAPAVAHVVDASGAGDAFMARLIECALQLGTMETDDRRVSFPDSCLEAISAKLRAAPIRVLGGVGARAALPECPARTRWSKRLASLRGQPLEALRGQLANTRPCCFCGRD
jgi:sugar/nucleoside kinase (ribokinase family)